MFTPRVRLYVQTNTNLMLALKLKPGRALEQFPSFSSFLSISNHTHQRLSLFLISNSNETPSLQYLLQTHALVLTSGNSRNAFIASKLIAQYAYLANPTASTRVFQSAHPQDTFLWNSLIKAHFSNGDHRKALDFFLQMRDSGFAPNKFTLPMVAVACADLLLLCYGKSVHGLAWKLGFCSGDSAVGSSFVYMYCKCGQVGDARNAFEQITVRDVIAWTALIVGFAQNGESEKALEYFCEMHRTGGDGERPNFRTLLGGFQACGNVGALVEGRWLHGLALKTGIGCFEEVKSSILSMYSKCGMPVEAHFSLCEMTTKDIMSWMSVISVYSRSGLMLECITLFWEMQLRGIFPDDRVISCVLRGFGNSTLVKEGKAFHGSIMRRCYSLGEMVDNALLVMYGKFGLLNLAEKLFSRMQQWTKESFSTMLSGYNKIEDSAKCVELFREMQSRCIEADSDSLASVISSCCQLGTTHCGRSLHCYAIKSSMEENISVANSLIDMYGKNGDLSLAWRIFSGVQKDIVTWNTMISCHNHNEHFAEAIALFDKMISENMNPNSATLVIVLSACSHLASLEKGENVHRHIKERELEINLPLGTALVDMYAKCGQLEQSRNIFDSMVEKDVISWNVMISGYGIYGHGESAIDMFQEMENTNVKPNEVTFLSLLSACNHSGLVEEGKFLFSKMQDYSLKPNLKHYACMVDLLGRSGNLKEAEALVLSMQLPIIPDGRVWGSLLNACIKHGEIDMGERVARRAIDSDPENDGYYITLSNIYSYSGRWEEAENVRRMMKERGVDKEVGWSVV